MSNDDRREAEVTIDGVLISDPLATVLRCAVERLVANVRATPPSVDKNHAAILAMSETLERLFCVSPNRRRHR